MIIMTVIVHISDLHISDDAFEEEVFLQAVNEINKLHPDMIILTGDITNNGYYNFCNENGFFVGNRSSYEKKYYCIPFRSRL